MKEMPEDRSQAVYGIAHQGYQEFRLVLGIERIENYCFELGRQHIWSLNFGAPRIESELKCPNCPTLRLTSLPWSRAS